MILHVDMDAFFASIEQAINPRLKNKPLIVGSRADKMRTVVCAASYEAKAFGISSGMPSFEAFKRCPNLEFIAADQAKYIWTSGQILQMLKAYELPLNYASIDEFQIDAGACQPLELAQKIQAQISQTFKISASIGMAKNCLLAKLASKLNKPNGIALITDQNLEEILGKTPVKKICGVGEKTRLVLEALGINTCLDLYEKSASFLEEHFGQAGLDFYYGLRSTEHLSAVQESSQPKSIGHSYTFPKATANLGFIRAWIRLLSEMIGVRLRQQNLSSKTIQLWLNGPDLGNFSRQKSFSEATNDSYLIYQRTLKILRQRGQNLPKIRALGITASGLLNHDYPALFNEDKRREALVKTLDKLNAKFGEHAIQPASIELTKRI